MQRILNILVVVGLFFVSFLIFLYMTFPFVVLKESVVAKINNTFPQFNVSIGELVFYPVGIGAEKLTVEVPESGAKLRLGKLDVGVGLLALLTGRVGVNVELADLKKGTLAVEGYLPIGNIIGQDFMPRSVGLRADNFSVDSAAEFGLAMGSSGKGANPMVAPLLQALGITGSLDGDVDLQLSADDPSQSRGSVDLQLKQAAIKLNDKSLGLNDQVFTKALVRGSLSNGSLEFDKESGFETSDLFIDLNGKVVLKSQLPNSIFDLSIPLELKGDLLANFGFLLTALVPSSKEGRATFQIRGPMQRLSFEAF